MTPFEGCTNAVITGIANANRRRYSHLPSRGVPKQSSVERVFASVGWQHLVLEACLAVPSAMYAFSLALRLDAMMLPIMARSASYWPDYTVAIINVGLVVVASTTLVPLFSLDLLQLRSKSGFNQSHFKLYIQHKGTSFILICGWSNILNNNTKVFKVCNKFDKYPNTTVLLIT